MQSSGAAISYNNDTGTAKGIVCTNDRNFLKENGGKAEFSMTWVHSLFKRIGFVRHKATTAKVPISSGFVFFNEIGFTFYQGILHIKYLDFTKVLNVLWIHLSSPMI